MPNVATIKADRKTVEKVIAFYSPLRKDNANPYIEGFFKDEANDMAVTVYLPKKGKSYQSIVFQGENAVKEASLFGIPEEAKATATAIKTPAKPKVFTKPRKFPQIGSDEVGTGDFFGPISVCAAYVDEAGAKLLEELGVTDSKLMTDERILELGPRLIKEFTYSQLLLENEKYNEVHSSGLNMNAIKAKMHNRCLGNVLKKKPGATVYQDQFAEASTYYSYLKYEDDVVRGIIFSTKGELHYPSVALASVIARYSFLRAMKALGEKYGMDIPFGASDKVDEFAASFIRKFGKEELSKIVKQNFANWKKLA